MADEKKISDLSNIQNNGDGGIKDEDVFVVVDSSITTGVDAGAEGKTSAISFGDLKTAVGTQGQKGEPGTNGTNGTDGTNGDKGQKGQAGSNGTNGTNGTNGDKGQKGQAGSNGTNGNNGDKGQKGQAGSNGNNGDKGQKGDGGAKGQKGQIGTSSDGAKGQKGETGATGPTDFNVPTVKSYFRVCTADAHHIPMVTNNTAAGLVWVQEGSTVSVSDGIKLWSARTDNQELRITCAPMGFSAPTAIKIAKNSDITFGGGVKFAGVQDSPTVFGGGGEVHMRPDDKTNPNLILYKRYSGETVNVNSAAGLNMIKGTDNEHMRFWAIGNDSGQGVNSDGHGKGDGHLASCIDATSLYFRNSPIYPGVGNVVQRNWKAAISPDGNILCVGNATGSHDFSDKTLKKDIERIESSDALNKVSQLSAVTFKWKEKNDDETHIGLIAQEVQEIVPEVVEERPRLDPNSDKTVEEQPNKLYVDYEKLVPLLIESVKELKSKVSELEAKLAE